MRKLLGMMYMLVILVVMMVLQVYKCQNLLNHTHFKYVPFVVCRPYFNKVVFKNYMLRAPKWFSWLSVLLRLTS